MVLCSPDAGIGLPQAADPFTIPLTIPACARCFRNRSFVLNFQTIIPRPRKDEDPKLCIPSSLFLWLDIFLEQVKKEEGKKNKTLPNKEVPDLTQKMQGSPRSVEWTGCQLLLQQSLFAWSRECSFSQRMPDGRAERGGKRLG